MSEAPKLTAADLAGKIGHGKERRYHEHEYETLCPAHDDRKPSLVVTQDGERILLFCRASCPQGKILDALRSKYGVEPRDLGRTVKRTMRCDGTEPRKRIAPEPRRKKNNFIPDGAEYAGSAQQSRPPAYHFKGNQGVWTWHDRHGRELFYTARFPEEDGGKNVRPITPWRVGSRILWYKSAPPSPIPMYDLHLNDGDSPVLVVEGEKTTEATKRFITRPSELFAGAVPWVTTTQGGCRKAYMSDLSPLDGRDLFIAQDMDAAGLSYAAQFLASNARTITLLRMPRAALPGQSQPRAEDIKDGYDLDDLAQEGWSLADLEEVARRKYLLFRLR